MVLNKFDKLFLAAIVELKESMVVFIQEDAGSTHECGLLFSISLRLVKVRHIDFCLQ